MLHLSSSCRYFCYNGFVDMRKGSYSLSALVQNDMHLNALTGDVFIFISKRANKIKLLQWDQDGFALYEKRLERSTFERPAPDNNDGHITMTALQLQLILRGVILKSVRQKSRFSIS